MDRCRRSNGWSKSFVILGLGFVLFSPSIYAMAANDSAASYLPIMNRSYAANEFVYNPRSLQWKAIRDGKVIRTGHGSGGRGYCPDIRRSCRTPTGTYHVISKRGADCRSSRYPVGRGGAPMPYCMFFSKYYAIHGSYEVPNYNASHGCIRLHPQDARWLSNNFVGIGTTVVVKPY